MIKKNLLAPIGTLPRPDLRYPAFRKYEEYIFRALHECYTLDPFEELNIKASTFRARFRDAILGFKTYKYESTVLHQNDNFDNIKLFEQVDGTISIVNSSLPGAITTRDDGSLQVERDWEQIKNIAKQLHMHELGDLHRTFVRCKNDDEVNKVKALSQDCDGEYDIRIKNMEPLLLAMMQ